MLSPGMGAKSPRPSGPSPASWVGSASRVSTAPAWLWTLGPLPTDHFNGRRLWAGRHWALGQYQTPHAGRERGPYFKSRRTPSWLKCILFHMLGGPGWLHLGPCSLPQVGSHSWAAGCVQAPLEWQWGPVNLAGAGGRALGLLVVLLSSGRVALHHRRGLRSSVQPREWGDLSAEPRMDTAWGRGHSVSSLQVSAWRGPLPCGRCVGRVDSQLLGGTCSGQASVAAGDAQTRSVPMGALSPCTYRPPGVDVQPRPVRGQTLAPDREESHDGSRALDQPQHPPGS